VQAGTTSLYFFLVEFYPGKIMACLELFIARDLGKKVKYKEKIVFVFF